MKIDDIDAVIQLVRRRKLLEQLLAGGVDNYDFFIQKLGRENYFTSVGISRNRLLEVVKIEISDIDAELRKLGVET